MILYALVTPSLDNVSVVSEWLLRSQYLEHCLGNRNSVNAKIYDDILRRGCGFSMDSEDCLAHSNLYLPSQSITKIAVLVLLYGNMEMVNLKYCYTERD